MREQAERADGQEVAQSRYDIGVLIGPCRSEDAEWLTNMVADYVYDTLGHPLGACVSCSRWDESEEPVSKNLPEKLDAENPTDDEETSLRYEYRMTEEAQTDPPQDTKEPRP